MAPLQWKEEEQEEGGLDHFASHDADRRRYKLHNTYLEREFRIVH